MNYSFHPEARDELIEAVEFYESRRLGLGRDFAVEVRDAIGRIGANPLAWQEVREGVRRCQTRRFPFGLLYTVSRDDEIVVLAVMNLHRKPGYWLRRLHGGRAD